MRRQSLLRLFLGAGLALAVWVAVAAAMALLQPTGRAVAVLAPGGKALQAILTAGGMPLRVDRMMTIARSDDPQFVRRLYAAGALLVLDAQDAGGCVGRTALRRAREAAARL